MKVLNLIQGSPEWLAARFKYRTASEAPAMSGMSPYISRGELLRQKFNGSSQDVSPQLQTVFDKGHESEANIRPFIESEIGEDLFPATVTDDEGWLSASLDGMTMNRKVIWEHKQHSQAKVDYINEYGGVPEADYLQVQQQLMITGAEKCLYTVGNEPESLARVWVEPNQGAFEDIIAGWKQFDDDLANYTPEESAPEAVGHTMESLPALRIELTGMVKASNLAKYKDHALAVFESINTDLQNDQDFADAENTVKWCKDVEDRLDAAKQHALSQTESIDELFQALDELKESARQKRLELDKLVKARKVAVRDEIRHSAEQALKEHIAKLEQRIDNRAKMPRPDADFASAMKNKRTIASLRDAVDQVLADAKITSSAQADAIQSNLKAFDEIAGDYRSLFPDLGQLSYKAPEDFTASVKLRIAEQKEIEAKRAEAALEAAAKKAEAEAQREAEAAERTATQVRQLHPVEAPDPQIAPAELKITQPAPELSLDPSNGVCNWRVTATFEFQAPEQHGEQEVIARMRVALTHMKSLQNLSAEVI